MEKSRDSWTQLIENHELYLDQQLWNLHESELGPPNVGHSDEVWTICEAPVSRTWIYPWGMS